MPGDVSVNIGCNYEDFLKGLATVKKEADLAVLEQRKKDQAEREERRAAARKEREERRAEEKEKQEAARKERKDKSDAIKEEQRLAREKEKAAREAQKAAEKEAQAAEASKNKRLGVAQGFLSGGLTGGISAIGAAFGAEGQLIAEAVNKLIEGFGKALKTQNLSIATGISVRELSSIGLLAENIGASVEGLARSFGEFNRRVGETKIKGSELNNLFNKLGVSQEELASGSMTAQKGMILLARAHQAGTDAATLAYYGNMMFGSSFNELLPAIKRGEASIKELSKVMYSESEMLNKEAAETATAWNNLGKSLSNIGSDIVGVFAMIFNWIHRTINELATVIGATFGASPEWIARSISDSMPKAGTDADRRKYFKQAAEEYRMEGKTLERYNAEVEKLIGEKGVKLTPLGLQTAQGASTIQQMGGGDIVSAIAFSPAQQTADNTAKTAENTAKTNELLEQQSNKAGIRPAPRR